MSAEYGFKVIDASRPVRRVAGVLRRSISRVIEDGPATGGLAIVKPASSPTVKEASSTVPREKAKLA